MEKKPIDPKLRPSAARDAHFETWGYKGRKKFTRTVPIIRPMPNQEPPARAAARYARHLLWAVSAWLGISIAVYAVTAAYHPLPDGQSSNMDEIFASPHLSRPAVNIAMSAFITPFMLIQWLSLRWYQFDRSLKEARADHQVRDVLLKDVFGNVKGDLDPWDLEKQQPQSRSARSPGIGLPAGLPKSPMMDPMTKPTTSSYGASTFNAFKASKASEGPGLSGFAAVKPPGSPLSFTMSDASAKTAVDTTAGGLSGSNRTTRGRRGRDLTAIKSIPNTVPEDSD